MTFPSTVQSLQHKAKDTDYESKHSRAVRYLNETQGNTDHGKKTGTTAVFFLFIILIISISVAVVSYFE